FPYTTLFRSHAKNLRFFSTTRTAPQRIARAGRVARHALSPLSAASAPQPTFPVGARPADAGRAPADSSTTAQHPVPPKPSRSLRSRSPFIHQEPPAAPRLPHGANRKISADCGRLRRCDRDLPPAIDRLLQLLGDGAPTRDLHLAAARDRRREQILAVGLDLDRLARVPLHRNDDVPGGDLGRDDIARTVAATAH